MSRRSTRSTSGIALPNKVAAEQSIDASSTGVATKNGTVKGKRRSAIEDIRDLEAQPRASKRSRRASSGEDGSDLIPKVEEDSINTHIKDEESSVSVTKKIIASRTKGTTAVKGKRVKVEDIKKEVKQEQVEEAAAATKQKTAKGKKAKGKVTDEMPLALRTKGLKMFVGAHVSAAQGAFLRPLSSLLCPFCLDFGYLQSLVCAQHLPFSKDPTFDTH
jgi:hypothetical protein